MPPCVGAVSLTVSISTSDRWVRNGGAAAAAAAVVIVVDVIVEAVVEVVVIDGGGVCVRGQITKVVKGLRLTRAINRESTEDTSTTGSFVRLLVQRVMAWVYLRSLVVSCHT